MRARHGRAGPDNVSPDTYSGCGQVAGFGRCAATAGRRQGAAKKNNGALKGCWLPVGGLLRGRPMRRGMPAAASLLRGCAAQAESRRQGT